MPNTFEDIKRICKEVKSPVNVLAAGKFTGYTLSNFAKAGVARVSLGSSLARVVQSAAVKAAVPLFVDGRFDLLSPQVPSEDIDRFLDSRP